MRSIDGTRVKEYFTCPRMSFFAFHRTKDEELPATPRLEVYFRAGRRIESEVLAGIPHEPLSFRPGDFEAGFHATLDAMARGVPAIANGVLKLGEFLGRPDLLLRDPGSGCYEVADIKSTQKAKASARMQVAFYSRMLAQIAQPPESGHVILRDGRRESFPLAEIEQSLAHVIERLQRMRSGRADPGPCWREHCLDCRYREICSADLAASGSIDGLPGVTRAQATALRGAGIASLAELAEIGGSASIVALAEKSEMSSDQMALLAARAVAVAEGRALRIRAPRPELRDAKFALAAVRSERLPEPHVAIAGSIFGSPDKFKVRFLRPQDSDKAAESLREFVTNLSRSSGPIVVFGGDVMKTLESAVDAHALSIDVSTFASRIVDLRAELRRSIALPSFDSSPALAARALGIDVGDDAPDVAALMFVEGEPDGEPGAIDAVLRRDLGAIELIRDRLLETEAT